MPYPANAWRATFFGALPGGEVWNCGIGAVGSAPTTDDAAQALAELIYNEFISVADPPFWPNIAAAQWNTETTLQGVRIASYPGGGSVAQHTGLYTAASPIAGIQTDRHPNQCASVITLLTGASGRRARGRMYIPFTGGGLTPDAQINPGTADAAATNLASCLSDWNASGDNGVFSVISTTSASSRPITSVRVDTRVDVQRRRANKQAADHTGSATVTT